MVKQVSIKNIKNTILAYETVFLKHHVFLIN